MASAASCTDCLGGKYCEQPAPNDNAGDLTYVDYVPGVAVTSDATTELPDCLEGFYCDTGTAIPG